jgi:NAD(P)-dependent dehydrogenase (short-subunit alcohol dehydrogenase family)
MHRSPLAARTGSPEQLGSAATYQEVVVTEIPYRTALIVGAGSGISASLARGLAAAGLRIGLAARNIEKLGPLAAQTGAETFAVDASDPAGVVRLFADADSRLGEPDVVLYNASARAHGPLADLDPAAVRKAIEISAYGGFLVVQQAARRMTPHGRGAILLTGASASVKGYPHSAAFAMGKFALRGLAQSAARELGPKGIHVAHFVIDGGVRSARRPDPADRPDSTLDPDGIAQTYIEVLRQPRSAWSLEVELRPWVETF